jgi:DNA repair ATPase RecN
LAWQIGELEKLAPKSDEWNELNTHHSRLANGQALLDAAQSSLALLEDDEANALRPLNLALQQLQAQAHLEPEFKNPLDVLHSAIAQVEDAVHTLRGYARHTELDPARLAELDARMTLWMSLARRYKRPPEELPALLASWKAELTALDAASDLESLQNQERTAQARKNHQQSAYQSRATAGRSHHAGHAGPGHAGRPISSSAGNQCPAHAKRSGRHRVFGGRPRRQHAAPCGQSGLGWRTLAHGAGHCSHHQPVGHSTNLDF